MKTGLFFGSFNPIHIGHLIISQYMLNEAKLDQIKFVVSPPQSAERKSRLTRPIATFRNGKAIDCRQSEFFNRGH
jgi:nicotinic acid mononucleotide adenylyltransferase